MPAEASCALRLEISTASVLSPFSSSSSSFSSRSSDHPHDIGRSKSGRRTWGDLGDFGAFPNHEPRPGPSRQEKRLTAQSCVMYLGMYIL